MMLFIVFLARLSGEGSDTEKLEPAFFRYESFADSGKPLHFSPMVLKTTALPPFCFAKLRKTILLKIFILLHADIFFQLGYRNN